MPDLQDRDSPGDARADSAPADIPAVAATGSSNVSSFAWQPTDERESANFAEQVRVYGSPEYAAMSYPGNPDGVLTVTFLSGATYQYSPVPLSVFVGMLNAPSRGRYVHQVVKQYPFVRV
jgi:hypothetical protein